jgi:hypothetical protein
LPSSKLLAYRVFIDIVEKAWRNPAISGSLGITMKLAAFRRLAVAVVVLSATGLSADAIAQYVWIDGHGVKQYSDMPPPSSVSANRILKQPNGAPVPAAVDDAPATASPAENPKPPMTITERNAEFRKRHAEQAEKEKKAAEQARVAAEKKKNCERAHDYQNTLASGERIARTERNGERSFLTDEQRAQEMRDVNRMLQECK